MDEFVKTPKYDLRETRFSQNYQLSIEYNEKEDTENHVDHRRNTQRFSTQLEKKNSLKQKLFIQEDQSLIYNQEIILPQNNVLWYLGEQHNQTKTGFNNVSKSFSYLYDNITKTSSCPATNLTNSVKIQNTQNSKNLQEQNKSESSDSEEIFSQKISFIRELQKKLQSLHQRIKIPSISSSSYLNNYKLNIQKEYETYTNSILQKNDTQKSVTNDTNNHKSENEELSQISNTFSQRKTLERFCGNDSIESQSMLLDKDSQIYQKQIPTKKLIGRPILQRPEVQIIETIRIVEIPYLIQVNRDEEQKIESKKSFYFEETEEIHKTFEEFTQKQSLLDEMLNNQTKVKHEKSLQKCQALNYSVQNVSRISHQMPPHENRDSNLIAQNSILSANESNRTFHNVLKDKRNDISFNYEENSQILSKLLTKHNPAQLQELEEKIKVLEIQNSELKQKIKETMKDKENFKLENEYLEEQLIKRTQSQQIYQQKLSKYKDRLQNLQQEFSQILYQQQTQLKQQYQRQIQNYQVQQTEYANRIIAFEEIFQDQKEKQQKVAELIEKQTDKVQYLQKICRQKEIQTENEINRRLEVQQYVIERERQLKAIIENLEKDNTELKHMITEIQMRYESEGFYILKEEAEDLRKSIEEKDMIHFQELDRLENRYSALIEKYQTELDTMKRGLEKVRLNKSTSVSNALNYSTYQYEIKKRSSKNFLFSMVKERQSFSPFHKIVQKPMVQCSQFGQSQSQIKQFSQLKMRHVESLQHSNYVDQSCHEKDISVSHYSEHSFSKNSQSSSLCITPSQIDFSQELLLLQMQTLREQNSKLKSHLNDERQQKHSLSQKLMEISQSMSKYMNHASETEEQSEKNEEIFMKCVQQLEKQYQLNKKLKEKMVKLEQQTRRNRQNKEIHEDSDMSVNNSELIKVHPLYIQLSKKYSKSRKYIGLLERQLRDLTSLPQFNEQQNATCCQKKQQLIQDLKILVSEQTSIPN